jgi:uncharacterized membrane protein
MERGRLEAFSDGVIAIAITLLVLDIKVPPPRDGGAHLADDLLHQWPGYLAYVVSFLTIGVIWMNHHATFRRLREVDHGVLILNLLLLMTIGVLPWSTSLLAEYLTQPNGGHLAAVVYGGSFLLLTVVFYGMQRYIIFGRRDLLHERIGDEALRAVDRRTRLGILPYVVATSLGLVSAYVTLALCALIAGYYALPKTIYERDAASN